MSELWDCYDRNFALVPGKVLVRGQDDTFTEDEYHLVCEITVRHEDGTYLLMHRDPNKPTFPDAWELSAGGSALKGETPEVCARRELLEETGLTADTLTEVGRVLAVGKHCHYVLFFAAVSGDKDRVTLQEGETVGYRWAGKETVLREKDGLATSRIFDMLPELELPDGKNK